MHQRAFSCMHRCGAPIYIWVCHTEMQRSLGMSGEQVKRVQLVRSAPRAVRQATLSKSNVGGQISSNEPQKLRKDSVRDV